MTTVEDIRIRVRSTRRVSSLPMIVVGLGVLIVALSPLVGADFEVGFVIAPVAAFALWLSLKTTASKAGVGMGKEHIGIIAVVVAVAGFPGFVPLLLGPTFLLGVLLFAVGWRSQDRRQWIIGVVIAVASPLLSYSLLQNIAYDAEKAFTGWYWFTRFTTDDGALLLVGLAVLVIGIRESSRETAILRRRPE
jgi:hypothetical protein